MNFKPTELKLSDCYNSEHYSLSDTLTDYATELLNLSYDEFKESFVLGYSLSNCQGDGVCFRKGEDKYLDHKLIKKILKDKVDLRKLNDCYFSVEVNSYGHHYQHENTFYIYVDVETENEKVEEYAQATAKYLTEHLRDVCSELEAYGYEVIESDDEEEILREAFTRFKDLNLIDVDGEIYEFDYVTTEPDAKDKYTFVASDGDTNIKGLWVVLPTLKEHTFTTTHTVFKEVTK